jgi:hypothetical protein
MSLYTISPDFLNVNKDEQTYLSNILFYFPQTEIILFK